MNEHCCHDGSPCLHPEPCPLREVAGLCSLARTDPRYAGLRPMPPCRHRASRWNCGGDWSMACAIGLGQAGIIDEDDCRGCDRAMP